MRRGDIFVTLVGCCHIGTKTYYSQIATATENHDVVLFEGVKGGDKSYSSLNESVSRLIGWTNQQTAMRHMYERENWVWSDLYIDELLITHPELQNFLREAKDAQERLTATMLDDSECVRMYASMIVRIFAFANFLHWIKTRTRRLLGVEPKFQKSMIEIRNSKVVLDMIQLIKKGNRRIGVLYGDDHVPHFRRTLKGMGFTVEKKHRISFAK